MRLPIAAKMQKFSFVFIAIIKIPRTPEFEIPNCLKKITQISQMRIKNNHSVQIQHDRRIILSVTHITQEKYSRKLHYKRKKYVNKAD